jgi:serine/threonine-protein kinase
MSRERIGPQENPRKTRGQDTVPTVTTETAPAQPVPQRLGRYRIDDVLGHGALGVVYRAFDPRGQRLVAIKALRPGIAGGPIGARLLEQARAVARMSHPNIVAVHEVEDTDRPPFVVMEYVSGPSLAQWLQAMPLPPQSLVLQVMDQLLEAIELAHRAGLRHGDVKAANVLLSATGLVKLSDFGLARQEDGSFMPGAQPELLAPEVALGRPVDLGVDVYAAGVLLYRMLTGRDPAVGAVDATTPSAPIGAARAPSSFAEARRPAAFDAIVARAMAREPGDRYPSAEAFREALLERFGKTRTVHGAGSVELAKAVAAPVPAPARSALQAVSPRVAAFAAKAAQAAKSAARAATGGKAGADPAPAAGPGPTPKGAAAKPADVPTLTIAIPDDVLSMPTFDPWSDSGHEPEAAAPARMPPLAGHDEDDDPDTISGVLPMDEEAYRAFIADVERERESQQAAAEETARAADEAAAAARARRAASRPAAPPPVAAPVPLPVVSPVEVQAVAPAEESGPAIPMEALRRALKIMTPHFGAGAGTVLKQVALEARSVTELHEMILARAGETIDRRKMRKQLKAMSKLPL